MKLRSYLWIPLFTLTLSLTPAFSQITVSGTGEIKVVPDEIHIRVGVETRDGSLGEAKRQHDERMKSALAFLKASGVPDKDVQTDFINVAPDYDSNISKTKPVVYVIRKSIEVKLATATNLEQVLTGLLNNGVNCVHGVDFRTTQLRRYRDEARAMAIRAAKEKAEAFAKELGVKCGKPLTIGAQEWGGWWNWQGNAWGGYGGYGGNASQNVIQNFGGSSEGAGETLSLGQISISASVNVSFQIDGD